MYIVHALINKVSELTSKDSYTIVLAIHQTLYASPY